jgi:hypothetical protein
MRKTTNFKRFQNGGAVLAEAPASDVVASVDVDAPMLSDDEASNALRVQIDALRESERIQKERNTVPQLTARQAAFIQANPNFLRHPEIAREALMAAHQAGHEQDSDEFHRAVKAVFDAKMMPRQESTAYLTGSLRPGYTPDDVDFPTTSSRNFVSAPVSRESKFNGHSEKTQNRVTLTPAMKEAARISGISERDYAEQVLRLRQEKADGNYGGQQ